MIYLAHPQYSHRLSFVGLPCPHRPHVHESDEITSLDSAIGTLKDPFKNKAMAAHIQKFIVVSFVTNFFLNFLRNYVKNKFYLD